MGKVFGWLVIIVCIYLAYQAGVFTSIVNYFNESAKRASQERVIEHPDGSITTVKYRSILSRPDGK